MSDLYIPHGKMSDFVSFPLFAFTLVIKLKHFYLKVIEILYYFLANKYMTSDLNISLGKMSDFVSFSLFRFNLVMKLRSFDFESHWNSSITFDKKVISDLIMFCQTVFDLV